VTQIANDTFTDSHPTNLTSHTSDSGHSWVASPGSLATLVIDSYGLDFGSVSGVAATSVGNTAEALISRVPDAADCTASIDVRTSAGITWDFPGVLLRASNSVDTAYRALLAADFSGLQVFTDKVIAGSETQLGSNSSPISFSSGDTIRLTLFIHGTTLDITLLNVTTATQITQSLSDSDISAIGQAGILFQCQSGGPHQAITAFSLSETVTPPTISPFINHSTRISPRIRTWRG
jgi:hypothetical protein